MIVGELIAKPSLSLILPIISKRCAYLNRFHFECIKQDISTVKLHDV